jgi:methylmalonyl-CoA mutase C-terminal domain/subunit
MGQQMRFLLSRDDWYHQRGYWVLAKALRNAGLEVVLGGVQTPKEVVHTAVQECVDVIGYRIMDAAPRILISILFEEMRERGVSDLPVVVGGIIPRKDELLIRELGVKEVFHPFTPLDSIIDRLNSIASQASKRKEC